jgi:hypothetical protein
VRGTWREGSLTGDPRGDGPFPGNLREGEIFLSGELLLGNPRDTKMKVLENLEVCSIESRMKAGSRDM